MTNIHQLLNDLGNAFESHLKAANDVAQTAQTDLETIKSGLLALVGNSTSNKSTGQDIAPIEDQTPCPDELKSRRRNRVSDEALLGVLNTDWATAAQVRKAVLDHGYSISEGTTYNRMRKLAKAYPDKIDTAAKPERWRMSAPTTEAKSKQQTLVRTKMGKQRVSSVKDSGGLVATNDNRQMLHSPVLHQGDCLKLMSRIAPSSVDLILADLPYGTTSCEGDVKLPLDQLWKEYRRILKPLGTVLLFSSQPFTTDLVNSNPEWLKYALVWEKDRPSGFLHSANRPMKSHEEILVFSPGTTMHASLSKRRMTYNPQGVVSAGSKKVKSHRSTIRYLGQDRIHAEGLEYEARSGFPRSILRFAKDAEHHHPFQKPLPLLEYLIKTYSNEGELVLDNTMGSGSTCVAAMNTGRRSVGIEKKAEWFNIAEARVEEQKRILGVGSATPGVSTPRIDSPAKAISPAVKKSDVTLYQGDCLEVMRTLPSESVDLVFTSPPYNLGVSAGGGIKNARKNGFWKNAALADGYASYDDARDPAEYIKWQKEVLTECWRLLKPDGAIFYQHKPRGQNKVLQTPLDLNPDLPVRQIIIWNRGTGMAFNQCYFLPTHEWIVVFAKPDFRLTDAGKCIKDVWNIGMERNNPHPAPFPVELPQTAIEATSAKVILDPFMGSGSTGVAALRCGREFIGIELDPGYLAGADARIEAERFSLAA